MENCDARIRRWRDAFDAMQRRAMKAEARMDDLAMLVKKLVRHVRKSSPDNNMAAMAMDYLEREGLAGSPLRDAANGVMGEREASAYEALLQALGYPWLPCPICKGTEGCDHSVPERARAALTAEKVAAEPLTWREAIKSYTSPDMTLAPQPVETQVAAVGYVNSEWAKYRRGTTTIYPEARPLIATSPLYDHAQPAQTQVAQAEPVGYMMKRKTGTDTGFSWHHDDPLFSADWERIPLYTAAQPAQTERALTGAQKAAISYAIGSIKAVPGWNDGIVETLNALLAAHPESGGKS
jgi:hypothetical protein